MATAMEPEFATLEEAYDELERRLFEVRKTVQAIAIASTLKSDSRATTVPDDQLSAALSEVARRGCMEVPSSHRYLEMRNPSLLDARMESLGRFVLEQATDLADRTRRNEPSSAGLTPEIIRRAWDFVWSNPNYRSARLASSSA